MKIERYSLTGFVPQFQEHHLKDVDFHLNRFSMNDIPKHLYDYVLSTHNQLVPFFQENISDLQYGVWVFISGYKNSQSLNHLKQKVPCWDAEIDDSAEAYDVNWTKKIRIIDPLCKAFGCYLPARELSKIINSKRKYKI